MTPMIDVVFLLIIFFLVSSHLAKRENSIPLDLPEASATVDDDSNVATIVVNVLSTGQWQVAGINVDSEALRSILVQRSVETVDALRLKIRTDSQVPYSEISPILSAAAQAGIGDIVFSVFQPSKS